MATILFDFPGAACQDLRAVTDRRSLRERSMGTIKLLLSRLLLLSSSSALLLVTGCVYSLHPYSAASQQKLHIRSTSPAGYVVQVMDEEPVPVAEDGRVLFDVPPMRRGCDVHLFGILKIADGSPDKIPAIHLLTDDKIVRKLSIKQIGKLPLDDEGYRFLLIKKQVQVGRGGGLP